MNAYSRLFSDLTNFKDVYAKPAARRKRSRNFLFLLFFFLSLAQAISPFSLFLSPFLPSTIPLPPSLTRSSLFPLKYTLSFLSHNAMVDVIEIHIPFPFVLSRWSLRVSRLYRKIFEKKPTKNFYLLSLQRFSFNSLDILSCKKILYLLFEI